MQMWVGGGAGEGSESARGREEHGSSYGRVAMQNGRAEMERHRRPLERSVAQCKAARNNGVICQDVGGGFNKPLTVRRTRDARRPPLVRRLGEKLMFGRCRGGIFSVHVTDLSGPFPLLCRRYLQAAGMQENCQFPWIVVS